MSRHIPVGTEKQMTSLHSDYGFMKFLRFAAKTLLLGLFSISSCRRLNIIRPKVRSPDVMYDQQKMTKNPATSGPAEKKKKVLASQQRLVNRVDGKVVEDRTSGG